MKKLLFIVIFSGLFVFGVSSAFTAADAIFLSDHTNIFDRYSSGCGYYSNCITNAVTYNTTSTHYLSKVTAYNSSAARSGSDYVRLVFYDSTDNQIGETDYIYGDGHVIFNILTPFLLPTTFKLRVVFSPNITPYDPSLYTLDFYEPLVFASFPRQIQADGITGVSEGGTMNESSINLGALLRTSTGSKAKLQIELLSKTQPFSGAPNLESIFVPSGTVAEVTTSSLPDGAYHWQYRAVDEEGNASDWKEFGAANNTDFDVYTVILDTNQADFSSESFPSHYSDNWYELGRGDGTTIHSLTLRGRVWPTPFYASHIYLQEFNDSHYSSSSQNFTVSDNAPFTDEDKEITFDNLNITLKPDKYYRLDTYQDYQNRSVVLQGATSNGRAMWNNFVYGTGRVEYIYTFYPYFVVNKGRDINVAVILAEPSDTPHLSGSITAQPCKLLDVKTYPNGHDISYYQDLLHCVKYYHLENSYGTVNFNFTVFDNNGEWYKITDPVKTYAYYANGHELQFIDDAVNAVASAGVDLSGYSVIAAAHSGTATRQKSEINYQMESQVLPIPTPPLKTVLAEYDLVGGWAHEIGHIEGALLTPESTFIPDLVNMGNVEQWDLMARGSRNANENDPPQMSSYTKEFLKFLKYDIKPKSFSGLVDVKTLMSESLGDDIVRYNLEENTEDNTSTSYYILEARNNSIGGWDKSIPDSSGVVLYYVDPRGFPKYGYSTNIFGDLYMNNACRRINIGGILGAYPTSYSDYNRLVRFSLVSETTTSSVVYVQPITTSDTMGKFYAVVLQAKDDIGKFVCTLSGKNLFGPLGPVPGNPIATFKFNNWGYEGTVIRLRGEFVNFSDDVPIDIQIVLIIIGPLYLLALFLVRKRQKWHLEGYLHDIRRFLHTTWLRVLLFFIIFILGSQFPRSWLYSYGDTYDIFLPSLLFNVLIWYFFVSVIADIVARIRRWYLRAITTFLFLLLIVAVIFAGYWWRSHKSSWNGYYKLDSKGPIVIKGFGAPLISNDASLDLDLHAITPDGRHVGMNYQTGQYENQIAGAIVSGDNQGSPEWILIPDGIEAKFYVSSYDNQRFLQENPDIASQLPITSDSYDIYARYIDPATGIFTSQTQTNQAIAPATNVVYETSGTSSISVSQGVVDNEPPVISHTALAAQYLLNSTPIQFAFNVADTGVGVAGVTSTLDGTSITSGHEIAFTQPGLHTITITTSDFLGNTTNTTIDYNVSYNFGGFLPPTKPDGSGIYRQGRTLPVKFQLTDVNNQFVASSTAKLFVAKIQDDIVGVEEVPLSTSQADTGNLFRYDSENNQYIYNLSTDSLGAGTWELKVSLDDEKSHTVIISIQ